MSGAHADVSSVSPSSERIEELWVVSTSFPGSFPWLGGEKTLGTRLGLCVVYIQKYGATLLVGSWQREKQQNKLVERKAFVDAARIKSADFCSRVFPLPVLP